MMPRAAETRAASRIESSSPAWPPHATFAASISVHNSRSTARPESSDDSPRSQLSSITVGDDSENRDDDQRDQRQHAAPADERVVVMQLDVVRAGRDTQR